jgi:hypothetical protein
MGTISLDFPRFRHMGFLLGISGQNWSRLGLYATREQGVVIRMPPLEFGCMENWVCMGSDIQGVGGC